LLAHYLERTKRDFPGYLDDAALVRYFQDICPQFLVSMGSVMAEGRPVTSKTFSQFATLLRSLRACPYLAGCEITMDNGGYQIQQGFLKAEDLTAFIYRFHDFLRHYNLPINWTFTLDLAPGKVDVFGSEAQLADLNDLSYSLAAALPESVRGRVIHIEHFRTNQLLRVWERMHRKGLPGRFDNFGTGGLASAPRKKRPPCIDYVIPLVRALGDARARGLTTFRYHVLGASQFQYFLAHALFERHIQEVHGIDIHITCDSTIIFSKFARCLALPVVSLDGTRMEEISLKSGDLNSRTPSGKTNLALFAHHTRQILQPFGMAPLSPEYRQVFRPGTQGKRDSISPLAVTYSLLIYIHNFWIVERWCRVEVERLYPLLLSGREDTFLHEVQAVLLRISESPPTPRRRKNAADMAGRILHSLHMLSALDWGYAQFVVDTHLNR